MAQKTISTTYGKTRLQSTYPPELVKIIEGLKHIAEYKSLIQKELVKNALLNLNYSTMEETQKITDEQLLNKMKTIKTLAAVPCTIQKILVIIELARMGYLNKGGIKNGETKRQHSENRNQTNSIIPTSNPNNSQ